MDLITTHDNADFDALSSVIAASKLYPKARLLLPGGQEKAVRNFMALIRDQFRIEDEKTCPLDDVNRLIIVDNRHKSRIGVAAKLIERKDLKVHIYDHHPRTRFDIKGDKDVFKKVGATVSILVDILDKKGKLVMTPLEATLMLLGIYEETGSLSYVATTKFDVDMVSKLLDKGANLNAVSLYLNRELTGGELSVLIELLRSIEVVSVNGIDIAFFNADASELDGEMGSVVHKLQDVENYPVIFASFRSKNRIKILARSREELVDVNKLLENFDGAGHSTAASARVEGMSQKDIKTEILKIMEKITRPEVYARDIMTSPVKTVSEDEKVSEVLKKLKSFRFSGAPVFDDMGKLVGVATRHNLKKAIKSKMGHSRVKGYMSTPVVSVKLDAPLYRIRNILLEKGSGCIPVVEDDKLLGVITRSDVLKKVHSSLFPGDKAGRAKPANLSAKMAKMLPRKLQELIRTIGNEADKLGVNVFVVGGFVRDIILGRKNYDLDIVVEGDAIEFGRILGEKIGGSLVVHKKFGTSTLVNDWPKWLGETLHPDNKFKIDIAMARKEVYKKPAALPTVEFSSLREDLYRRDFTINAMAVKINKKNFGLFIDFFGGMKDLKDKTIRVLHDKSFIDDPTRIFRAVRFEQRFGFSIEKHTEYLIKHAIKQEMFHRTENQRIRDELVLILKERDPENAVFRMKQLHELRFIHPDLVLKRAISETFNEIKKCVKWYERTAAGKRHLDIWLIHLMAVLEKLKLEQVEEVIGKFVLTRSASVRLVSYKAKAGRAIRKLSSPEKMLPSEVYDLLEPLSHEVALYVMARTRSKTARTRIKKFFTEYNGVKLRIKGHDLIAEGAEPGPGYTRILRQVLCEKLDGKLHAKKDELEYMRKLLNKGKRGKV